MTLATSSAHTSQKFAQKPKSRPKKVNRKVLDNLGMVLGVYRAGNQEKHSAEPGFGPWDDCTAWLGPGHAQQQ